MVACWMMPDMDTAPLGYIGHVDDNYHVFVGGRPVGTYTTEADATLRLAHVDQFRAGSAQLDDATLQALHLRIHELGTTDINVIAAHDIIETMLEERQVVAGIAGGPDDKLDALKAGVAKSEAARYTLGPVYVPETVDAHDELVGSDDLQKGIWDWVRKGDRNIYLQHTDGVAGEMVEILTWPQEVTATLTVAGVEKRHTFPEQTPFMGVIWEPWAWDLVEQGKLRGYSIGGQARRVEVDLER